MQPATTPNFLPITSFLSKTKKSEISLISTSDIHLGHDVVPSVETIEVLDAIIEDRILHAIDLLVLGGDITERLLNMDEIEGRLYIDWVTRCLRKCKKYNVVLFVLLGTPSHDWKQPQWIVDQNNNLGIGCELYYANTISVVRIESLEIDVLAIPDEALPSHDLMWEESLRVMKAANLEQVDFCFMHGFFDFQIPEYFDVHTHSSEKYLSITRYLIFIGHDHTTKIKDRIIVNGSLNRLKHGHEEPKGFYAAVVDKESGDYRLQFVENHWAKRFIQINITPDQSANDIIDLIKSKIEKLPADSHVQLIASREELSKVNISEWRRSFPLLNWTFSPLKEDKNKRQAISNNVVRHKPISIVRENITEHVLTRLLERNVSPEVMEACKCSLEEYVENVRS